ncbi:MAG TPA: DciA family protein [Bacillota bacterium]
MTRSRRPPAGRPAGASLGEALQRALAALGYDGPLRRQRALDVWPEAVGPALAAHSRAVGWRGDALVIEVDDPAWAQQMTLLQATLLSAVNRRLDQPVAAGLHFRIRGGRVHGPAGTVRAAAAEIAAAREPDPADVPPPYRAWLEHAAQCGDEELGAAMGRWLLQQLARRTAGGGAEACPSCGAPMLRERRAVSHCPACAAEWRPGGLRDRVRRVLEEEPWLSAADMAARVPGCGARTYAAVRGKLLQEWQAEFQGLLEQMARRRRGRDRLELRRRGGAAALRLACLITGLKPVELSDEAVLQALGPAARPLLGDGGEGRVPVPGR